MLLIQDRTISAYAYRGRMDLDEVILSDEVEAIGEGAFAACYHLKRMQVGSGVKQIGIRAFDGLAKNVRLIWLSDTPYRSPLYRILPSMDRIASICAPKRPFSKTAGDEKIALACGFLLHPELEEAYKPGQREAYEAFILEELPQFMGRLVETDVILEVIENIRKRHLFRDKETLKNYISYARTRVTNHREKHLLDSIEEEEGLVEGSDMKEALTDTDKELLRHIHSLADPVMMDRVLESQGLIHYPELRYRSGKKAPVELLKFIRYRYICQWPEEFPEPPELGFDAAADRIAELLDPVGLREALSALMTEDDAYVRRCIPALRCGPEALLDRWMAWAKELQDYEAYGRQGMIAARAIQQAALLSEEDKVPLNMACFTDMESFGAFRMRKCS